MKILGKIKKSYLRKEKHVCKANNLKNIGNTKKMYVENISSFHLPPPEFNFNKIVCLFCT